MKKSLLTMAAALALVSCSQEELLPNGSETVANGKIGANIFVPTTTRGAALNTVEDLISSQNGFDLVSYYNLEGTYTEFMGTADDGIQFKHDGSAWDYADRGEIHFWQSVPDEATEMKFFAVSPTKENLPTDASYSIGTDAQTITYTVPTEVSEQKDLMFAQTDLEDGEYEPTSEVYRNGVPLNFHHALSQIVFKARIADKEDTDGNGTSNHVKAYVNSVSIQNVHGAGTFNMNSASAILGENYYEDGDLDGMDYDNTLWTPSDDATNGYTVSELTNNESIDWIEAEDLTNGAIGTETAMLLLPQQLVALDLSSIGTDVNSANEEQISVVDRSAGAYLEVNCRVEYTNNAGEVTYIVGADANSFENIYIPISTNWQPGYKYVYTLIFSADSGDPVKAIVESVDEWNTAAGDNSENDDDNDDTDDSNMLLLNMNAADMFVGDELEILVQTNTRNADATLTFTYPNDEMFETTEDNKIKAKKTGQAEVIVSCDGYDDATVTINVMPAIEDTELTEGIKTVRITGNTYTMGNDYLTEDMYGNLVNAPSHSVTVNDFIIGQYEVSVEQYVKFLNTNTLAFSITEIDGKKVAAYTYNDYSLEESEQTRYIPLCILDQNGIEGETIGSLTIKSGSEKLPVICSWEGAATFAKSVGGYLPHEEEWEYAARGGVHQKYAWWQDAVGYDGEDWYEYDENKTAEDIKSLIEQYENFPIQSGETDGESYIKTHTLRDIESTKKGNAYGLYDVFGNVSEWCGNYDYDYNTGLGNETDHRFRGDLPTLAVFGESSSQVGIHNFNGVAHRDINADMLYDTDFCTGFRVAFASDYSGTNSSVQTVSQGE